MKYIFFLERPTKYFWTSTAFVLIIWLIIGPLKFRHVDDYGPLEWALELNLEQFYFFLKHGWGTYPPIWNFFLIPSFLFKGFGIDIVRYMTMLLGFISTIFSSYLTFLITNTLIKFTQIKVNKNFQITQIIEILSIIFNCLNPLIFLYSNSYMPYNLGIITSQLLVILFLIIPYEKIQSNSLTRKTIIISFIFSIFFSFQSLFLISSVILYSFKFRYIYQAKRILGFLNFQFFDKFYKENLEFKNKKIINFLILFLIFIFTFTYFQKFLDLIEWGSSPGKWAVGLNEVFNINLESNNIYSYTYKVIYSTISIIGQATYPLPYFQYKISILISILLIISTINLYKLNKIFLRYFSLTFFIFLITIFVSSNGRFIYSPSRHTMFLYPFIWIPLIVFIVYFSNKILNNRNYIITPFFIGLIITYSFANMHSISLINYTKEERITLLKMLDKSEYTLKKSYNSSRLDLHGTKENLNYVKKLCDQDYEKAIKPYTVFLYSHRGPFEIDNLEIRNHLNSTSNNCIPNKAKLKIIDQFEKVNDNDIEQNINIQNGGSNIYAYIVEIS